MWEITNERKYQKTLRSGSLLLQECKLFLLWEALGEGSEVRNGLISPTMLSGDKVPCQQRPAHVAHTPPQLENENIL